MTAYDDRVIAEFRGNGGRVEGYGTGLVLVHSTGARSGEPRINPALALQEGGCWLVIASAAGAAKDPGWAHNLRAHPDCGIETPHGSVDVHAIELSEDDDLAPAFARFVARSTVFDDYRAKAAPRRMPIFRLEPRG